jgi:carbohydrate diacid regulator
MRGSEANFVQIAGEVSRKAAELLGASVIVADSRGTVVAASERELVGRAAASLQPRASPGFPLTVGERHGEISVSEPSGAETVPEQLTRGIIELLISQATQGRTLPDKEERKDAFIHSVLHGLTEDEDEVFRQARTLGLDLAPPRAVILIDASHYLLGAAESTGDGEPEEHARQRARHVISSIVSFFRLPDDTICAYIGAGEIAILKASDTKNLVQWAEQEDLSGHPGSSWANLSALKRAGEALLARLQADATAPFSIGIGRFHRGFAGLARSYEDARAALSLGRRFQVDAAVHCLDSLGTAAFIGVPDEQTKVDLARYLLSPLDGEPELIRTLEALFSENCRALAAARRLGIHRNTLGYRLDKICQLTGLDARLFEHAVQIRLALLLRSLQADVTT